MKLDKDTLKLSVVIPCYNERKTLENIIGSVKESGIKNLEIIIVDDYSTDGTRELLQNEVGKQVDKVLYLRSVTDSRLRPEILWWFRMQTASMIRRIITF